MAGTFFGIHIGLSALRSHLRALEVTGHNVANASNPAYTRQEAVLRAARPWSSAEASGTVWLGSGVRLVDVRRVRDGFLTRQVWYQSAAEARARTEQDLLGRVEGVYQEPSDDGLQALMDRWWAAWQELANQPESTAVRQSLLERSRTLIEAFRTADRQLADLAADVTVAIDARVTELNGLAARVAELNRDIARLEAGGGRVNDLRDERDELVGRLVQLAGVAVQETQDGGYSVWLGGAALVDGTRSRSLQVVPAGGAVGLAWSDTGGAVQPAGGELAAFVDFVQRTVPDQRTKLAALAADLSTVVNQEHRKGFGLDGNNGRDFFLWQGTLATWDLDPQVAANPDYIGASSSGAPGDGSQALAIADLRYRPLPSGDTLDDAYRSLVVTVGIQAEEAGRRMETAEALLEQARQRLQEVSGVSLDEEMARMVELQHAYAAAARMVSTVDEMIETLVHRTGVVGR